MYIGIIYFVKWSRTVRATVVAVIILNDLEKSIVFVVVVTVLNYLLVVKELMVMVNRQRQESKVF